MEQTLVLLNGLVFLDMLAVGLVIPLIPYLAEDLNMGPELYGLLGTFYQAAQLFGSLFMGVLSDSLGKKGVLLMSFAGSAVSYLILGLTQSISMMFFSRLMVGAVKQTVSTSTSLIAELPSTTNDNMSKRIGMMRASMSVGFIIGPLCGGKLSTMQDHSLPCMLACILFIINSIIVIFFLSPPNKKIISPFSSQEQPKSSFTNSLHGIRDSILNEQTRKWLLLVSFNYFAVSLARSNLPQANKERFGTDASGNGIFMAISGASGVITQMVMLPFLANQIPTPKGRIVAGTVISMFSYLACVFAPTFAITIACFSMTILGSGIIDTFSTASYSRTLPEGNTGGGIGVLSATKSFMGVIAPSLAGLFYQFDPMFSSIMAGCIAAIMFVGVILSPVEKKHKKTF